MNVTPNHISTSPVFIYEILTASCLLGFFTGLNGALEQELLARLRLCQSGGRGLLYAWSCVATEM